MATIAEVRFLATEFALSHTLATLDDVNFEIERIVAHDPDQIMPYVWVTNTQWPELDQALSDDPTIETYDQLASPNDNEALYQMAWIDSIETLVQILVEEEGAILAAEGRQDGWNLRVLFPDRAALSRTYEFCNEHDFSFDLKRVYNVEKGKEGRFGLTEEQEELIVAAYEQGLYDVPRKISLMELAEWSETSHQAISERLRRGHKTLVENSVIIGQGGGDANGTTL